MILNIAVTVFSRFLSPNSRVIPDWDRDDLRLNTFTDIPSYFLRAVSKIIFADDTYNTNLIPVS